MIDVLLLFSCCSIGERAAEDRSCEFRGADRSADLKYCDCDISLKSRISAANDACMGNTVLLYTTAVVLTLLYTTAVVLTLLYTTAAVL